MWHWGRPAVCTLFTPADMRWLTGARHADAQECPDIALHGIVADVVQKFLRSNRHSDSAQLP
jgi:hypothetical protein